MAKLSALLDGTSMSLKSVAFWLGKLFGWAAGPSKQVTKQPHGFQTPPIGEHVSLPIEALPHHADAWEGAFYDSAAQKSIKKAVLITYCDGNGNVTKRRVDIKAFDPHGADGLVIGRCHLRQSTRTFRFDRMREVIDVETGEIISNLQGQLNAEWSASPAPVIDVLFADHHDVLKLLLYMAKADGAVRSAELGVIAEYCSQLTGDGRINVAMVKDMLQYVDSVSIVTFTRTYNKLRRERPSYAAQAANACKAIVATQKTVHLNEQAALEVLDKPLAAT